MIAVGLLDHSPIGCSVCNTDTVTYVRMYSTHSLRWTADKQDKHEAMPCFPLGSTSVHLRSVLLPPQHTKVRRLDEQPRLRFMRMVDGGLTSFLDQLPSTASL